MDGSVKELSATSPSNRNQVPRPDLLLAVEMEEAPAGPGERRPSRFFARMRLAALREEIAGCTLRPPRTAHEARLRRRRSEADLLFVGEAPGAEEDIVEGPVRRGRRPAARQDLRGGGNRPREVFIRTSVKCRPPGNRDPEVERS
jgi:uracil-DNA glycosylase